MDASMLSASRADFGFAVGTTAADDLCAVALATYALNAFFVPSGPAFSEAPSDFFFTFFSLLIFAFFLFSLSIFAFLFFLSLRIFLFFLSLRFLAFFSLLIFAFFFLENPPRGGWWGLGGGVVLVSPSFFLFTFFSLLFTFFSLLITAFLLFSLSIFSLLIVAFLFFLSLRSFAFLFFLSLRSF